MNGRMRWEPTLAGRLAACVFEIQARMRRAGDTPDYADYRDGFELLIREELLRVRTEEVKRWPDSPAKAARLAELEPERLEVGKGIAQLEVEMKKRYRNVT